MAIRLIDLLSRTAYLINRFRCRAHHFTVHFFRTLFTKNTHKFKKIREEKIYVAYKKDIRFNKIELYAACQKRALGRYTPSWILTTFSHIRKFKSCTVFFKFVKNLNQWGVYRPSAPKKLCNKSINHFQKRIYSL